MIGGVLGAVHAIISIVFVPCPAGNKNAKLNFIGLSLLASIPLSSILAIYCMFFDKVIYGLVILLFAYSIISLFIFIVYNKRYPVNNAIPLEILNPNTITFLTSYAIMNCGAILDSVC